MSYDYDAAPNGVRYSRGAFGNRNFQGFNNYGQAMFKGHWGDGRQNMFTPDPFQIWNNNVQATVRNLRPVAAQNLAATQRIGGQLGSISDLLNNPKVPLPPRPPKPGLSVPVPPAPVNYVSSDRLNEGKGWSKFRNQAKGTDQFDQINALFHQMKNVGSTSVSQLFQQQPGYQQMLEQAAQYGMTPEEFLQRYL